jgi:hypothetical protein
MPMKKEATVNNKDIRPMGPVVDRSKNIPERKPIRTPWRPPIERATHAAKTSAMFALPLPMAILGAIAS